MRKLNCLRCTTEMTHLMREFFQKGECGAWVGNLNFNLRGGFEMDVYSCPKCGKLEFYLPDTEEEEIEEGFDGMDLPPQLGSEITRVNRDGIPQVRCRACGKEHDFDYPACPHCGFQRNM
jgi:DNA-directed RNA polymerase subunit RPC12/RpoP